MKRARVKGFTLMELLIVVIIVGILASIALPQFKVMTRRARATEAQNMVGAILTAEWVYYQENNAFVASTSANVFPAALGISVPGDANSIFDYTSDGATPCVVTATADGGGLEVGTAVTVVGTLQADGSRTVVVNNL
ncbi:MAG: prepilin-type N-terminal cleavage/methylation domain-containing protein [Candidatus Omnitrophica bacterium]|nr:prepilin-type N-terminal cleavage/methylation domain-containing protein [Candidatus Omnitrophota bacterium]